MIPLGPVKMLTDIEKVLTGGIPVYLDHEVTFYGITEQSIPAAVFNTRPCPRLCLHPSLSVAISA